MNPNFMKKFGSKLLVLSAALIPLPTLETAQIIIPAIKKAKPANILPILVPSGINTGWSLRGR